MEFLFMFFINGVLAFRLSAAAIIIPDGNVCKHVMEANGLTVRFAGAVVHGIHSITLEDIRYYFKPDATKQNGVPTLNYDLTAKHSVLPNSQLYGFDTSFKTIGMQHLDQVMMNMDKDNFYLAHYNTLEKLVHTIHMNEVWAKTKVYFDDISANKQDDETLCRCVTDMENNGVMKMLHLMSLKIRSPSYAYYKILNETTSIDIDNKVKRLDNEDAWKTWKSGMKSMVDQDNYELAMFLYCTWKE